MTNGELIRMMGDEELAELMTNEPCPPLHRRKRCPEEKTCLECWAEWLKMEVSEQSASQVSPAGAGSKGPSAGGALLKRLTPHEEKKDPAAG